MAKQQIHKVITAFPLAMFTSSYCTFAKSNIVVFSTD